MHLCVKDVARMFNVTEGVIERWISERKLPSVRIDKRIAFDRPEILEWAAATGTRIAPNLAAPWNGSTSKPRISDSLMAGGVHHLAGCGDAESALAAAVDRLELPASADRRLLLEMIRARESAGSTGIGSGIAIPHPNRPIVLDVDGPSLTLFYLSTPVDFHALDGKPVSVMFLLISPSVNAHLHLLSRLAFAIREDCVREALGRRADLREMAGLFGKTEIPFS